MNSKARDDALTIWRAGVAAVDSQRLVQQAISSDDAGLTVASHHFRWSSLRRILVVGAGKAGAGMARGVEAALSLRPQSTVPLEGWVNVPADCVAPLPHITLHAARPAGLNEPTVEGVQGAREILRRVGQLGSSDLCIALISGGGSALLPAPRDGISLQDLLHVTRHLSAAGATIEELNLVRQQLSLIQAGRLALACRAGALIALIISDVMGDPLPLIASGPTVVPTDRPPAIARAIDVCDRFGVQAMPGGAAIRQLLADDLKAVGHERYSSDAPAICENILIGNNQVAVDAAAHAARNLGYEVALLPPQPAEITANEAGQQLAHLWLGATPSSRNTGRHCLISGGEPVVRLADSALRGRGGRNQQLVLAALCYLQHAGTVIPEHTALLSGGTDGEDGPTDAAGAILDHRTTAKAAEQQLDPRDFLRRNDAYSFFQATDGLIKTGPTHTNVCDLRVAVIS